MTRKASKICKLVALAAADERRLAELTGRFRRLLNEEVDRLGELNAYRQGYAGKSQELDEIDSAHLKDFQNFMTRLDQAVLAQQQVVENCEHKLELHRRRWMIKKQRLDSLNQVLDRYASEDALQADRREQRAIDDRARQQGVYGRDTKD